MFKCDWFNRGLPDCCWCSKLPIRGVDELMCIIMSFKLYLEDEGIEGLAPLTKLYIESIGGNVVVILWLPYRKNARVAQSAICNDTQLSVVIIIVTYTPNTINNLSSPTLIDCTPQIDQLLTVECNNQNNGTAALRLYLCVLRALESCQNQTSGTRLLWRLRLEVQTDCVSVGTPLLQ